MDETRGKDYWANRMAVASVYGGYADAKVMRHLHETYGLHIADQVIKLRRETSLKIPWLGLRHEFLMMGMNESSVESMLAEAKEFEKAAIPA